MAIPFLQEANVDGIIRVLRTTGTIGDNAAAEAIRNLHNGLTEAEMDAIIGGLNLGGSGGRMIASDDNTFILLDDDALPAPPEAHTNFLRVLRWQNSTTINDPRNQVMSTYWRSPPAGNPGELEMVIGPDTAILDAHGTDGYAYAGRIFLGGERNSGGQSDGFGYVGGGPVMGAWGDKSFRMHASSGASLSFTTNNFNTPAYFALSDQKAYNGNDPRDGSGTANFMLGGWHINNAFDLPGFYVGDHTTYTSDTDGALLLQKTNKGWQFKNNLDAANEWINILGSNTDHILHVMVNGDETGTDARRDPATQNNSSFTVFGTDSTNDTVGAFVGTRTTYSGDVMLIRCYDEEKGSPTYDMIEAQRRDINVWDPIFRVTNLGDVSADGAFIPGGADAAEWVVTDEQYVYGTVLVVAADGTFTKSTEAEDAKIAGVVALKPGLEFGRGMQDASPEGKRPMTVCGITPVICTTAGGDIAPGDLLVTSATAGAAQKVGGSPTVGTILGKALGTLEQPAEDPVIGEVSSLIILQ